jgi:hypothetical protein
VSIRPFGGWVGLFMLMAWSGSASAAPKAHSTDPWDWIIQHVCADGSDRPVPADPYDGYPSGTHERRLKLGDLMPYLRHDQPAPAHPDGVQRHDSYPRVDHHFGGVISATDFDFDYHEPYGVMHPGDGDGMTSTASPTAT